MTPARIGIVFNPSKIEREQLEKSLAAVGVTDASWFETTPDDPGQGPARAALADGCALVIAAGGDGTVRAVAEVLAGTDTELAIVPQGTGNLLARNLGVPLGSVKAALTRAVEASARQIDLGWVDIDRDGAIETHGFVVMVGFGLDAHMLAETSDDLKKRAGWLAYVEAMGRAISATELVGVTAVVDGGEAVEASAHTVLIGNCGTIQGGITLLPDAAPDDGTLDLLAVSATGMLEWAANLKTVVWDNGLRRVFGGSDDAVSTETMRHVQATRIEITLAEPRAFEIDGEEIGDVTRFTARIDAGVLRVR